MTASAQVTFRINKSVYDNITQAMIDEGYGKREFTKWIKEALLNLLDNEEYISLIDLEENTGKQVTYPCRVVLPNQLNIALNKAVINCRKELPHLGNIKSSIVRTAIKQRLLRRLKLSLPGEQNAN